MPFQLHFTALIWSTHPSMPHCLPRCWNSRLLKLRTKELNHVRNLAHQVLLQRSEVEAFLLSSIQQVRLTCAAVGWPYTC